MSKQTNDRKIEHINIITNDETVDRKKFYFDDVLLKHRAMPEIDLEDVDTSCTVLGKELSFPLLISSMTGGDHELVKTINKNLATAAEACKVAMGVGSQRVMFENPDAAESFAIRQYAPTTLLFANLGAVQLNYGFTETECQAAVDHLEADALFLHLNPLQEAVQPEGDCNFADLCKQIGEINKKLTVEVALKEVGAGISVDDAKLALSHGITYIDVAGSGGISWSKVEQHRNERDDLGTVFQDWGIPTPIALESMAPLNDKIHLFASGGVRTGIDMAKAIILNAELCGLASPFLKAAMDSPDAVIKVIESLKREFQTAMFLLGMSSVEKLKGNKSLILKQ